MPQCVNSACTAELPVGTPYCGTCGSAQVTPPFSATTMLTTTVMPTSPAVVAAPPMPPGAAPQWPSAPTARNAPDTAFGSASQSTMPGAQVARLADLPSASIPKVALAQREEQVRAYHVLTLGRLSLMGRLFFMSRASANGFLLVTTQRLILIGQGYARRGTLTYSMEVQLNKVAGLQASISRGRPWFLTILAASAAALVALILALKLGGFFWLLLLVAAYVIYRLISTERTFHLAVYASQVQPSPVQVSLATTRGASGARRFFGRQSDAGYLRGAEALSFAMPGPEAEKAVLELGAVIGDLQTDTVSALTRWR